MARFRTHMSFGFLLAVGGSIFLVLTSLISNNLLLLPFSAAVLLGSMMPDLDSDKGLPFQLTFWTFGITTAGIVFYFLYLQDPENYRSLVIIPLLVFACIRFVIGAFFKKITRHRGMFHSLPATAIAGMLAYLVSSRFPINETLAQVFALGVGIGYLGHLVLDEIYATINFNGKKFRPSNFLGSALKLYSGSKTANITCYILLVLLITVIMQNFR